MNQLTATLITGVTVALITSVTVGGFGMYNDVQLLKNHAHSTDASLRERAETAKDFMKLMSKMESSLAANTEAINTLKDAVKRLEQPYLYSYQLPNQEINYDRRD